MTTRATSSATPSLPVEVVHDRVPGRLRLRVRGLGRISDLAGRVEEDLSRRTEIQGATIGRTTDTILILFDPDQDPRKVTRLLEEILERSLERTGTPTPEGVVRKLWSAGTNEGKLETDGQAGVTTQRPWHHWPVDEVLRFWGTDSREGLSPGEVQARVDRYGPNRIPVQPPRSTVSILIDQLTHLPVVLLLGSSALSLATGGVSDAVAILAVVTLNAAIGTYTESRSQQSLKALPRTKVPPIPAVRVGSIERVEAEHLVPGDILRLERGTYVPADLRLLRTERLTVDESALTGESMPVIKHTDALDVESVPLGDRRNMLYRGTLVTGGSGLGVVVATGTSTQVGQIQRLATSTEKRDTPIERQLDELGRQLAIAAGCASGAIMVIGLLRGHSFLRIFKSTVSLAVASIPEGLPAVATTTLSFGVRRMRNQGILIRRLEVAEALGAVQVLCLDKTGTLTTNRMVAVAVHTDGSDFTVEDHDFVDVDGNAVDPLEIASFRRLLEVCLLNSEHDPAEVDLKGLRRSGEDSTEDRSGGRSKGKETEKETEPLGEAAASPTEDALLHLVGDSGLDPSDLVERHGRRDYQGRSEDRMYVRTLHDVEGSARLVTVKGRPDQVLNLCDSQIREGNRQALDHPDRERIQSANERMAGNALRVLGIAYRILDEPAETLEDVPEGELTWVGLVGIEDPVRPEASTLIEGLRTAGIRPIMITGDQSATAYAVARQLGLGGGDDLEIIDSSRLEKLDSDVLAGMVRRVHVFSRVSPAQKQLIVDALQRGGHVVGMTGDGINDGPALRRADVGIALRSDGTEVAQEIADVVLAQGDLEGMIGAVAQGRTLADDIGKSVHFIAATNMSEVLFTLLAVSVGGELPLNPKQLLWINLLSDVFPELALSVEPPEDDVLDRPPRDAGVPIISPSARWRILAESGIITSSTLAAYLWGIARYGPGPRSGTLAFTTITVAQLLHTITSRSETHSIFDAGRLPPNRWVGWAVGGGFSLQLLAAVASGLRSFLGTDSMSRSDLLVVGGSATASFVANELVKLGYSDGEIRQERLLPTGWMNSEDGRPVGDGPEDLNAGVGTPADPGSDDGTLEGAKSEREDASVKDDANANRQTGSEPAPGGES